MTRLPLLQLTFLAFSFFITSCYYDNQEEIHPNISDNSCDTMGVVSYSNDIVPILNNNCGTSNSCHGSSNISGVVLNNYASVQSKEEKMVKAILHDPTVSPMPNGGTTINICSIKKIQSWVGQGSLNN